MTKRDAFEKQFGKVDWHTKVHYAVDSIKVYCEVCGNEIPSMAGKVCQGCIDSGVADRFYDELEEL